MELNPDPDRDILYKIIYSAIAAGHYDWAQTQLDSFLQKEPVNSELLRLQAILRAKKGQYEDAQKIFSSAYNLAAAPGKQTDILRRQARILLDQDNTGYRQQAEILLEKAWVLEPANMGTFKMRQELYSRMNRLPEKKNFYQTIRERLEPGNIIDVKLYRTHENREVQCYYYGVPCNLPWHGIVKKYKKGSTIRAIFRGRQLPTANCLLLTWF
jgi:tetratricopeptide (TPR) repeat protein